MERHRLRRSKMPEEALEEQRRQERQRKAKHHESIFKERGKQNIDYFSNEEKMPIDIFELTVE